MTDPQMVLLTGFPSSFLARRVLAKLLVGSLDTEVTCVVPDNFMQQAQTLRKVLPRAERKRVELITGDVSAMDFGMPGRDFLDLAARTQVIHHCPTANRPGIERRVAEQVNIGGAGEVLELAESSRGGIERVVHWSSASVSGKRSGHVLESELIRPPSFRSVVEETLFRAERVMREAMDHLPITVLRPSMIVGDSRTGEIDRLEGPYMLILLMLSAPVDLRVPLPGRGDTGLNLVPIDYVVDAGLTLASDPRSIGRTFHLVDDQPPTARRVFELIAEEAGRPGPVGSLPTQIATALLRTPGLERFSHIPRTFLEELSTDVVYDDRNTQELLAGTGIVCPSAASYLKVMVDHVRREQRARAQARKNDRSETERKPVLDDAEDPLA